MGKGKFENDLGQNHKRYRKITIIMLIRKPQFIKLSFYTLRTKMYIKMI